MRQNFIEFLRQCGPIDRCSRRATQWTLLALVGSFLLCSGCQTAQIVYVPEVQEPAWTIFDLIDHSRSCRKDDDLIDVNLKNNPALLHVRNRDGDTPLMYAVKQNEWAVAERLLKMGADPNTQDESGDTAMRWALGNSRLWKPLLAYGAKVDIANNSGQTPLTWAVRMPQPDYELIMEMLRLGSPLVYEHHGRGHGLTYFREQTTILHDACGSASDRRTALPVVAFLVKARKVRGRHVEINAVDSNGQTALYDSIRTGDLETVEFLLKAGAEVENIRDHHGRTALDFACEIAPAPETMAFDKMTMNEYCAEINQERRRKIVTALERAIQP